MRTPSRRLLALALLPFVAAHLLAIPAAAEEPDAAKEMVARLVELRKLEDAAGLMEALGQAPAIYKDTKSASLRSKLLREVGKVLKDKDAGDARVAAVEALVAFDEPKGAWKEIAKVMPSPKVVEATALDLALVKAAGRLAQSRAIGVLLDLVASAVNHSVGRAAAEALGGYRRDRRNRVKLLEDLLSLGKRIRPGVAPDKPVSVEATKRWEAMGPAIVVGMNTLTGQLLVSFEDWEAHYKEFKKRPRELFLED